MQEHKIRDRDSKVLAVIRTLQDGDQEIRDTTNRRLGYYEPNTDTTFDSSGRRVGFGNLLTTLIDDDN